MKLNVHVSKNVWPGSVYDNTCWENSLLYRENHQFFLPDEHLIADAGYALSNCCIIPYKLPDSLIPHNALFNQMFSSARVTIEHVNGILKARWMSLKNLRIQVKKEEDLQVVNHWVRCCCILHNMMLKLSDTWEDAIENDDDILLNDAHNIGIPHAIDKRTFIQQTCLAFAHEHNIELHA